MKNPVHREGISFADSDPTFRPPLCMLEADMPRDRTANHPPTIGPRCRALSKINRISAEIRSELHSQNRREWQHDLVDNSFGTSQ